MWYHYLGGIIPWSAKSIATVYPQEPYKSGLCSHSSGGIVLFYAKSKATVFPLLLDNF